MASQPLKNVERSAHSPHAENVYGVIICFISMHRQTCAHALTQGLNARGWLFCMQVLWISHRYMSALQHSQGALI